MNHRTLTHKEEPDWNRFLLMKTSKRNTYVEVKAYVFYLLAKASGKSVDIRFGGNPYNPEDRRSYAKYNKMVLEYKRDYFNPVGVGGVLISSPEELIKELGIQS